MLEQFRFIKHNNLLVWSVFIVQATVTGVVICGKVNNESDSWVYNPEVELPERMTICKRYATDRDECIKASITNLLPVLGNGYKKLGIDPLDPFIVPSINWRYKQGTLMLGVSMKNATTHGITTAKIRGIRSKVSDSQLSMEVDVLFPQIITEAYYKGQGNINTLGVKSKGYINATFSGVEATWKMTGVVETIDGEDYMKIKSFDMHPTIQNLKVYATGLFPDPDVNQFAVEFLNQYWRDLYKQMYPYTRQVWEPVILGAINKVFGRVPYQRLMPKE